MKRTPRSRFAPSWFLAVLVTAAVAGGGVLCAEALASGSATVGTGMATAPPAEDWRPAALFGADVRSLVHDPRDADVLWAGTSGGQIYRSRDGGGSWSAPGVPTPFPGWVVATLLFDPDQTEPGRARIWAGLWGVFGGGLVAWSEDDGRSWVVPHPVLAAAPVYALARPAGSPGLLFAGTRAGVLRSPDAGRSWTRVGAETKGLVQVESLWVDPSRPQRVIAGTWRRAYRSEDAGESWVPVFEGMVEDTDVFTLSGVPGEPETVWAATCGWVYRSQDAGASWRRLREGLAERRTQAFAVVSPRRLLAGTVAGVYRSEDGGESWQRRSSADLTVGVLAVDGRRPDRVMVGTEGAGIWRSLDGGETFAPVNEGLLNVRVGALAHFGGVVWAAVNHAGPLSGIYRSLDGGRTFAPLPEAVPTVLDLVSTPDALWAHTEQGLFRRDDHGRWFAAAAADRAAAPALSATRAGWAPTAQALPATVTAADVLAVLRLPDRWLLGTASDGLWLREQGAGAGLPAGR